MIQTYKFTHDIWDVEDSLLTPSHEVGTRGHEHKLFKQRFETNTRGHFFSNRVIDLWNSLPHDVVTAPDVDSFKNRLDSHWETIDWLYDYESK